MVSRSGSGCLHQNHLGACYEGQFLTSPLEHLTQWLTTSPSGFEVQPDLRTVALIQPRREYDLPKVMQWPISGRVRAAPSLCSFYCSLHVPVQ